MNKVYLINNKEYIIPKETTYLQYKRIKDILSKLETNNNIINAADNDGNLNINLNIIDIIKELFDKDLIPQLLATILIPADKTFWSDKIYEEIKNDMFYVTDSTVFEVAENFLLNKTNLIQSMINYLGNLTTKKQD